MRRIPWKSWAWTDLPMFILAIILLIPLAVHLVEIVVRTIQDIRTYGW